MGLCMSSVIIQTVCVCSECFSLSVSVLNAVAMMDVRPVIHETGLKAALLTDLLPTEASSLSLFPFFLTDFSVSDHRLSSAMCMYI